MPASHPSGNMDLRQLRVLQLLLTERSISRVAELLRQSQPTVSASLKRLREAFNDPLLVRSGQAMVLTERAQEIREALGHIIDDVDELLAHDEAFDPGTARRPIRIATATCFDMFLIPRLTEAFRHEAPQSAVEFTMPSQQADFASDLESGRTDAVIGNWPALPQNLRYMALLRSPIACLVARDHPAANRGRLELATYLALDHVSPTPARQFNMSPIDGSLARLQLSRRIAVAVPEYALIPMLLPGSQLVFTTGRPYAEYLARDGALAVLDAPPELGAMTFYLLWHERSQFSKYHHWLRTLVRRVAKDPALFTARTPALSAGA